MPVRQFVNRKREHTRMPSTHGWVFILIACVVFFVGCAPQTKPIGSAPPPPVKAAEVTPLADTSSREAAKLRQQVDALGNTAGGLRGDLGRTRAEMDRLKAQKTASEKELDALWDMFTRSQEAAARLFAEVEEAQAQAAIADERAAELAKASALKDAEVNALRTQNAYLSDQLDLAKANEVVINGKLVKAEKKAAVAEYYTRLLLIVGGVGVFSFIAYFLIKALPSIVKAAKPI